SPARTGPARGQLPEPENSPTRRTPRPGELPEFVGPKGRHSRPLFPRTSSGVSRAGTSRRMWALTAVVTAVTVHALLAAAGGAVTAALCAHEPAERHGRRRAEQWPPSRRRSRGITHRPSHQGDLPA